MRTCRGSAECLCTALQKARDQKRSRNVRDNFFEYFTRGRRMRALARQALEWRERILTQDPLVNLEFAAWLLQSPDHVQGWLELTAFDEEVARCLGYPENAAIVAAVTGSPGRASTHDDAS